MRGSVKIKILATTLIATLMLLSSFSIAQADTENWVLPWSEKDHNTVLNGATITYSDVNKTMDTVNVQFGGKLYNGLWHGIFIELQSMGPQYLPLIAPASGTVLESTHSNLAVMTDDGDLYFLQIYGSIYGSNSTMYSFAPGNTILMGQEIGKIDLMEYEPTLEFDYLVQSEPSDLFMISKLWFVEGFDLKVASKYGANLYSPYPDLEVYPAVRVLNEDDILSPNYSGWNVPKVYEPRAWILFDTGVRNSGQAAPEQAFSIQWLVNGQPVQLSNDKHCVVPPGWYITEDNSFVWLRFEPGTYYVEFVVNWDSLVEESDYTNNRSGITIYVGY